MIADATDKHFDTSTADSRDKIARRAHQLFLERGGQDGSDVDDWLAAEAEIAQPSRSGQESVGRSGHNTEAVDSHRADNSSDEASTQQSN
jgi:hypothetical protein